MNGERRPRLEWISGCSQSSGTGSASVAERQTAGASLGRLAEARSNVGRSISYSMTSQAPASGVSGCPNRTPFSLASNGIFSVKSGVSMLDYEKCPKYTVGLRVTDASVTITCSLTVNLADRNDPPVLESNPVRSVEEGSEIDTPVGDAIGATDEDRAQELLFSIVSGNDAGFFRISRCSGLISVYKEGLDYETVNKYQLVVRVEDDGNPSLSAQTTVTINIINRNEPPTWVRTDYVFAAIETCTNGDGLDSTDKAVQATDADADTTITYSISRNDRSAFAIGSSSGVITVADCSQLNYEIEGERTFSIEVQASDGEIAIKQSVTITALNGNESPEFTPISLLGLKVSEGASQGAEAGQVEATDEDDPTTLTFSITGGAQASFFAIDSSTGSITVSSAGAVDGSGTQGLDYETAASHTIQVTVQDSGLDNSNTGRLSTTVSVTIAVTPENENPVLLPQGVAVLESLEIGDVVGAAINFTDPDNEGRFLSVTPKQQTHTLRVISVDAGGFSTDDRPFLVDQDTRTLRLGTELDFETSTYHRVTLELEDSGGAKVTAPFNITVLNVNEAPRVTEEQSFDIDENTNPPATVGTVLATDPDGASDTSGLTFEIVPQNGTHYADFSISSAGVLSLKTNAASGGSVPIGGYDFETSGVFKTVAVRATDPHGAQSEPIAVSVVVIDLNEDPWLPYHSIAVREQSEAGLQLAPRLQGEDVDYRNNKVQRSNLVYTIVSKDAALTWISLRTDGTLVLDAQAPSYTSSPQKAWNMTVQVEDLEGLTGTGTVQIVLLDGNFNPNVTSVALEFPESTKTGTLLLDGRQSSPTALGSDEDNDNVQFLVDRVEPEDGEALFLLSRAGRLQLGGVGMNYELNSFYRVFFTAQDDGNGKLETPGHINITITDSPEYPKVGAGSFSIRENATAGSVLGTVAMRDEDLSTSLTLQLLDPMTGMSASACFAVSTPSRTSGVGESPTEWTTTVTLKTADCINFEERQTHDLAIKATDEGGLVDYGNVTITIIDINERPTLEDAAFTLQENPDSVAAQSVGQLVAADVDANTIFTYTIVSGNENGAFGVGEDGRVKAARPFLIDRENITSYTLGITVTDSFGQGPDAPLTSAVATVSVTVTNEDDMSFVSVSDGRHDTRGTTAAQLAAGNVTIMDGSNIGPTAYRRMVAGGSASVTATMQRDLLPSETGYPGTMDLTSPGCVVGATDLDVDQTPAEGGAPSRGNTRLSC